MLEVTNLFCSLNGKRILHDINFALSAGDFLGVVGPNGAGKTTLLRVISGIIAPDAGNVLIEGKDVQSLDRRSISHNVAMVPQNTYVSFPFTAFEVVLMGRHPYLGRFAGEAKQDLEKVKGCMQLTRTWHLRDTKVTEISGGELQRVIIAQVLAQDTPLLLLDEPTSHLDINHELEILEIISRLNKENNKSVMLVSHDLNLAARYCDTLLLLKEGAIFAKGAVERVLTTENIRSAYHLNALVKKHPLTGCIYTLPLSLQEGKRNHKRKGKIHLIGGGGSASRLMKELFDRGYEISLGVVNVFDADFETARVFEVPCVVEAPFSPITEESYCKNIDFASDANLVILCNVPFGRGNLLNLKAALWALKERGTDVIVHNETPIEKRDYTNGQARTIFHQLLKEGAVMVQTESELISCVEEHFALQEKRKG